MSTERLTHTLSGEPAVELLSGLIPFVFKQEATKSRGGDGEVAQEFSWKRKKGRGLCRL